MVSSTILQKMGNIYFMLRNENWKTQLPYSFLRTLLNWSIAHSAFAVRFLSELKLLKQKLIALILPSEKSHIGLMLLTLFKWAFPTFQPRWSYGQSDSWLNHSIVPLIGNLKTCSCWSASHGSQQSTLITRLFFCSVPVIIRSGVDYHPWALCLKDCGESGGVRDPIWQMVKYMECIFRPPLIWITDLQ